jgi:hypothetical protein
MLGSVHGKAGIKEFGRCEAGSNQKRKIMRWTASGAEFLTLVGPTRTSKVLAISICTLMIFPDPSIPATNFASN